MTKHATSAGVVKWRLPSDAREILTAFASEVRRAPHLVSPEERRVADAVERALESGPGDPLREYDRLALLGCVGLAGYGSGHAVSGFGHAVTILLCCVDALERFDVSDGPRPGALARPASSDPGAPGAPGGSSAGVGAGDCPRCGFEIDADLAGLAEGDWIACSFCGRRLTSADLIRARVARADRGRQRDLMLWITDPTRYLVSLSLERVEILGRAGTPLERTNDSSRLEVIDEQLTLALSGERAEYFRGAIRALAAVVDLARSQIGADL